MDEEYVARVAVYSKYLVDPIDAVYLGGIEDLCLVFSVDRKTMPEREMVTVVDVYEEDILLHLEADKFSIVDGFPNYTSMDGDGAMLEKSTEEEN